MPLENALNGTPGLKTLRSKSVLGLSSVVLLFEEGTNLHIVRQFVQERVSAEAARLPTVARPPVILQPLSSLSRVMKIGVSSKTLSQRSDRVGDVDDPSETDVRTWGRERGDVGAARQTVSSAGRSRSASSTWRHARTSRARGR